MSAPTRKCPDCGHDMDYQSAEHYQSEYFGTVAFVHFAAHFSCSNCPLMIIVTDDGHEIFERD